MGEELAGVYIVHVQVVSDFNMRGEFLKVRSVVAFDEFANDFIARADTYSCAHTYNARA